MLTLALLRHAKSSWDDPAQDDFQRPLNARGKRAAPEVGRWLAAHEMRPDLILCSTAVRTRATLALLAPELSDRPPRVRYMDGLYLAGPGELLDAIRGVPASCRRLLVIGHNPGMHALAVQLAGKGRREELGTLRLKFPTAALALLDFDATSWAAVAPGGGALQHFVVPPRAS